MDIRFEEFAQRLRAAELGPDADADGGAASPPGPVHVVYGGADLYRHDTPAKLGRLALRSLETYAPDIHSFADAMWLRGAESVPQHPEALERIESRLTADAESVRAENEGAWFAWRVRERVLRKLEAEPVEDFRIDFEDGYGIRSDEEEDADAGRCAAEFSQAAKEGAVTRFSGIRIKSLRRETYARAVRTLEAFVSGTASRLGGLPPNFAVTLPKVRRAAEVSLLAGLLSEIESGSGLPAGSIGIELMVETPEILPELAEAVRAGGGRVTSAHFGAYDYTAFLGITANHQHLMHEACVFARQMMQVQLSPLGTRLSDSVTTEMPVPVHRVEIPTEAQHAANTRAVHNAWRKHFNNVTRSLIGGFYQSWDLHPAQLVARYAALTAFFLEGAEEQGERLRRFVDRATKATMSGNLFDDAASAQGCLNFFSRAAASGALDAEEAEKLTGLTAGELASGSFREILEGRGA